MAYKRKTKDVVCQKCKKPNRIPVEYNLKKVYCGRKGRGGWNCLGPFKLLE